MFDALVPRYDLLNDVLSLGWDRVWRRRTAAEVVAGPGDRILDLGCGTGRMAHLLASRYRVVGLDVSHAMLVAASRDRSGARLSFVEGSAFGLPFPDQAFGGAVSGFVLRNLDDLPRAFAELARVLRAGASAALVDITEPKSPAVRRLFDAYFRIAAPAVGRLVGRRDAYRYLVTSLAHLPPREEVCAMLERAGFTSARARVLRPGMVTLWTARRE